MKKLPLYIALVFLLIIIVSLNIKAVNYRNYTYNFWEEAVPAPQAYTPYLRLKGQDFGIDDLNNPQDLFVDNDSNIYILDSGNDRIIILNENFELRRIISEIKKNNTIQNLSSPRGIFVTEEQELYIADTGNQRVVKVDNNGNYLDEISGDIEGEIRADQFRPLKIAASSAGRIYVVARGVDDGLMVFDIAGEFSGYIGAPEVTPSPTDIFWMRMATQEQRARRGRILFVPTDYLNLNMDWEGFIYGVVRDSEDPVRRLNLAGQDQLKRDGFTEPVGDVNYPDEDRYEDEYPDWLLGPSRLVDVAPFQEGLYRVLDRKRGRIFTYDNDGRLLYVMGGRGHYKGLFRNPVAVENLDGLVLVLDSRDDTIQIFEPTEYATLIHDAIREYHLGLYNESYEKWLKVLRMNTNNTTAYTFVGRNLFRQEKLEDALLSFRAGQNRGGYSRVLTEYRREIVAENFNLIIYIIFTIILSIIVISKFRLLQLFRDKFLINIDQESPEDKEGNKLQKVLSGLIYARETLFHPLSAFWDLKHEKDIGLMEGNIFIFLVVATFIFVRQYTGFIFNPREVAEINIFVELASVLVPLSLWCFVNWSITTLMDGKGTLKDIYIGTAYALIPFIVVNIPVTVISNYLTQEESGIYVFFIGIGIFWSFVLLFFGMLSIHSYTVKRNIITFILTVVGISASLFLILLVFSLIAQMMGFVSNLYLEFTLRYL